MKILLRKRISVILILAMIITTIPFTKVSAYEIYKDSKGNEWIYERDWNPALGLDGSTYKVRPASKTLVKGDVTIPREIDGTAVTTVHAGTTGEYSNEVTSVTIPNTIINIGNRTFFGWSNLTTVIFEEDSNLQVIQSSAFNNCFKLSTINIPASVEKIGLLSFEDPIEYPAFEGCLNLQSITVDEGSNYFKSEDGVLFNVDGSTLYKYPINKVDLEYEIPASVKTIKESAFNNNTNIQKISLSSDSQLTTIDTNAFVNCIKLSVINELPPTLVEIGGSAFGHTPWLEAQITPTNPYLVINGFLVQAFYSNTVPQVVNFPEGVITIGEDVFANTSFSGGFQLTIPASVKKIDKNAFVYMNNLTSVQFAENSNLEVIGKGAFSYCNTIKTLDLPDKLTTIEERAFANMGGLRTIAIPDSVTNIGEVIIANNNLLERIYTNNQYIKSSELYSGDDYIYTFEPYENYSNDPLTGAVDITGVVKVGETLTADTTGITNIDPGNYKFRWYRVDAFNNVQGNEPLSSNNTYQVTQNDVGYKIKLVVSAANCYGELSAITADVPKANCPEANVPTKGVVQNDGANKTFTFTGLYGVTYEYTKDNGENWIKVADPDGTVGESVTFTIILGNVAIVKGSLQVRAAETNAYYASAVITNDAPYTANLDGAVVITGSLKYNETLTAEVSNSQSDATLNYSWYRSDKSTPIQSGSNHKYVITGEDVGKTITVKVSAIGYTGVLTDSTDTSISKAEAVITIPNENRTYLKTYGYADFNLEGISNNVNGSYTYKISHPDVLSIAPDGKVHIVKAMDGTVTIEIGLVETNYYTAPQSIKVFINIGKADKVSISLGNLNQVSNAITKPTVTMNPYSKTAFDKVKVEYGVMSNDLIEWSESLPTKEGNYKVRATLSSADANLDSNIKIFQDITTGEQDFVITKYEPSNGGENPGGNPNPGGENPSTGGNTNSGSPSSDTDTNNSTVINEDGSTTKKNTKENADGSSTTTITTVNKDGSKTEKETTSATVKNKDGSSKTTESMKETITAADGTSYVITTKAETSKNTNGTETKKSAISLDNSTATAVKTDKTDKDGNIISSVATISTNESKVSVSKTTATVGISIPEELLKAVAAATNATDVTFMINTEIAKAAITDNKVTAITLALSTPAVGNVNVKGTNLSKEVANLASQYKKDLTIKVEEENGANYSVKITSGDLKKVKKDLNLSLEISRYKEVGKENAKLAATIKGIVNSSSIQVVSFSDNKILDAGVTLSYDLSKMSDVKAGDKVYIYKYNSKTNKLEETPNNSYKVKQGGTITTTTIQGGDFIVSTDKLSGKQVTKLIDKITVNTVKTSVKVGSKSNIAVTLPVDVLKVTNFDSKSNPVGKEEAQITYKVNDESIAKVDAKGNITTKKAGNVIVTVTIKLENGQKKSYKKAIQVK